jgi:hypothetical protein
VADRNVDDVFAEIISHWDDSDDVASDAAASDAAASDAAASDAVRDAATPAASARDDTAAGRAPASDPPPTESSLTGEAPPAERSGGTDRSGGADRPTRRSADSADSRDSAAEDQAEVPWPVWRGALVPSEEAIERAELAGADDDGHFVPGPLAPLPPTEDLHFWGIVVGLVAGPLLLLWLVIVRPDVSGWWTVAAVALTVGGFALLVLRQPKTRDADDPDNGARL